MLLSILSGLLQVNCSDSKTKVYVGIDLGTTFSCVSIYNTEKNRYEFLNFGGENPETIPSVVYVEQDLLPNDIPKFYIGHDAIAQNKKTPVSTNYFFGFKRLMGIPYADKVVADFKKSVTYTVEEFKSGKPGAPNIVVFPTNHSNGVKKHFSPTDLSALVLGKIFSLITQNYEIISTVITTPAYFTVNQDEETRIAAKEAGFTKVNIFKEPTAACIEYAQTANLKLEVEEKILVFDLGGGTFDISIVEVENEKDENKKTNSNITVTKYKGDNFLGGENVNNAIFDHFKKQINKTLSLNEAMRLRVFTEEFKIKACNEFKSNPKAVIKDKFFDNANQSYEFSLTQAQFNTLAKPVYDRIDYLLFNSNEGLFRVDCDKNSLDKGVDVKNIDKIVLVGGSTRIPYIKEYLKKKFTKATIFDQIDADKSVAGGACRMCVNSDVNSGEQTLMLLNATTLPIGIAVYDGSFKAILEKDVVIPTEASEIFSTVEDNQTRITLQVATGVRPLFSQNEYIGTFELELKDPKPKGQKRIEVKCAMSEDYKLTVTATDLDTKISSSKVFKENYVGTDKKMVQEILKKAKETELEDMETRAKLDQMHLFTHALDLYETQFKNASNLSEDDKLRFKSTLDTYREWYDENKTKATSEQIQAQLRLLEGEAKELADAISKSQTKKDDDKEVL